VGGHKEDDGNSDRQVIDIRKKGINECRLNIICEEDGLFN